VLVQPLYVAVKLLASFDNIIVTRLNPFKPVAPLETRRHLVDAFVPNVALEPKDALPLITGDIIPAKVDTSIVLGRIIASY